MGTAFARNLLVLVLSFLTTVSASATTVAPIALSELVERSDHVIVAHVLGVDMIDARGKPIVDPAARTGPGSGNEIRLHLQIREVIFTRSGNTPKKVVVRLWKAWHYSLGQIQEGTVGLTSIFLLKGENFDPAYPADFQRDLSERAEISRLVDRSLRYE